MAARAQAQLQVEADVAQALPPEPEEQSDILGTIIKVAGQERNPDTFRALWASSLASAWSQAVAPTYWTVAVRVVVRDVHCELKYSILVQSMPNEDHSKPHCRRSKRG